MKRLFTSLTSLLLLFAFPLSLASCSPTAKKEPASSASDHESKSLPAESTPDVNLPRSIRILSIGNSFSDDAMEHFWNILHDLGIEEIILGNLYIGGCSLDRHYENMQSREPVYQYRKNTSGKWISKTDSLPNALSDEAWDIVTLQQASHDSGQRESYKSFDPLLSLVRDELPKQCKIYWHMTWAYQADSTHTGFQNYANDQTKMYTAITEAVEEEILSNFHVRGIIPAGTAIQNLRTSYIGDTLTRDGYHMSYGIGRCTVSMAWVAALFGADAVDLVTWCPEGDGISVSHSDLPAIREAAKNAAREPFSVTASSYPEPPTNTKGV